MILTEEQRVRHGVLSSTHLQFLDHMERTPGGLELEHFAPIQLADEFTRYPVQSWPVFLGEARRRYFAQVTLGVSRLIRSVPQRFFGNDPARLREFYGLSQDQAVLIATLIRNGALEGGITRCDFLETEQGLQCVEVNAGNLGGWQTSKYLERFARIPAFQGFIDGLPGEVTYRSPVRALFANFIEQGRELAQDGELNVCFAVDSVFDFGQWVGFLSKEFAAVMAAFGEGLEGNLIASEVDSLKVSQGVLWAGNRRVHIVHQPSIARLTRPLLIALLANKVRLFNGPTNQLVADKGNLAVVSAAAEAGLLDAEEKATADAWIPWTRQVVPGKSTWRGEEVDLPRWLVEERQRLVLKARGSLGGIEVHVGRFMTPESWAHWVDHALADGRWVVQEYVATPSYMFLAESGCVEHDMVWGLFSFGERYGGGFFRVQQRRSGGRGVVNAKQGASFGLVLEVEGGEHLDAESVTVPRSLLVREQGTTEASTHDTSTQEKSSAPSAEGSRVELASRPTREGFLSEAHHRFAEYVAAQPAEFLHSNLTLLHSLEDSRRSAVQPWPVLLPRAKAEAMAEVAAGLARLFLELPRRIFDNDRDRYQEFYRLEREQAHLISTLTEITEVLSTATAQVQLLETAEGLKCLEFNVRGGLGSWTRGAWTEHYFANPLVRGFAEQSGLELQPHNPFPALFQHILAESNVLAGEGELNIAFLVPSEEMLHATGTWAEDYQREYQALLAASSNLEGFLVVCCQSDLRWEKGKVLLYGDRRIHAVVEVCHGEITGPPLSALLVGTARVFNGPASRVLGDSLNLALLSRLTDSDLFTAAEQQLLRAHIPWTRPLSAEFVNFEGERAYVPDLLADAQHKMVIKSGYSPLADEVWIGATTPRETWLEVIDRALAEQGWVVQEFLRGTPYLFQNHADPGAPPSLHDVVWGFRTLGDQVDGCFVRLQECGGDGVVNAARGACVGVVLEVEEDLG